MIGLKLSPWFWLRTRRGWSTGQEEYYISTLLDSYDLYLTLLVLDLLLRVSLKGLGFFFKGSFQGSSTGLLVKVRFEEHFVRILS